MPTKRRSIALRIASLSLAVAITTQGCVSTRRGPCSETELSYCASWPNPPMLASASDSEETRIMAAGVNMDWARRCQEQARSFCERRNLTGGFCSPDAETD